MNLDNLISPILFDFDNELLCHMPTPIEIKDAVFSMHSLNSTRTDGLLPLIYKTYWHIVVNSVVKAI